MAKFVQPMTVHKNNFIDALRRWPEDVAKFCPGYTDAKKAIADLEAAPGEWFYSKPGGKYELITDEELKRRKRS